MAGYIFGLDSLDSLRLYTSSGVYGTKLSPPARLWMAHHEGTFADFATGIVHQLATRDIVTCSVFGNWDYVSHQVVASPFKPVDYMDKMDLFGYAYVPGFKPRKSRFLVCEIKRDAAHLEDIDQLMKYVDWVRDEYCFGDYAMIRAFFVAYEFDPNAVEHKRTVGTRKYTVGVRPARSLEWNAVKLVRYAFNPASNQIDFTLLG